MTAVHVILALFGAAAAGGITAFALFRGVPQAEHDAVAADARRGLELSERLVEQLERASQRELRANEIADERRGEAHELRAELDRRAHADLVGERVVVRTIDGHTIEGDLERLYADGYLLSRAQYLQGDGPRELGGYITVRQANESFVQRPAVEEPA